MLALALMFTTNSEATTITTNECVAMSYRDWQYKDGQDFYFNKKGLDVPSASEILGGTFTLKARGDYGTDKRETLRLDIEGFKETIGAFNSNGSGGKGGPFDFVTVHNSANDYEFQKTYYFTGAEVYNLLADGMLNIAVKLSNRVGANRLPGYTVSSYMDVEFAYVCATEGTPVPEPATVTMLGLGLIAIGAYGRYRKN